MDTRTYGPAFYVPMGRSVASSSLPPELKVLLNEVGNNYWQFDAVAISRMFSPTATPPVSDLVDVAHCLLEQEPSDWPEGVEDSLFHQPLANFLNNFVAASHLALDLLGPPFIEREARWCTGLRFVQLVDESCGTHDRDGPVKREAVGGIPFREADPQPALAIAVKLDEDWPAVVAQAVRSAQVLYSACHLRTFGLIIGFRYTTLELRFLIVHRGGLTASKPLSVVEERGKKDILRVFLSILMWRTEEDAGIPEFLREPLLGVPVEAFY